MKRLTLCFLSLVFFSFQSLHAEAGRLGGLTLRRTIAARPAGLGEAYAGVTGDVDGIPFNPSGVAQLPDPAVSSTFLRGFADDNFGSLSYAHNFSFGAIFIGGSYFDAGKIDLNQSDGTQGERDAQRDTLAMAGFALGRKTPVSIGITGKYLRSELAETASASVFAADAGIQWHTPVTGLHVGAVVQNMGSGITYEEESDPIPQTGRVGLAYYFDPQKMGLVKRFPFQLLFTLDGLKAQEESAATHAGLEISHPMTLGEFVGGAALRGGYRSDGKTFDIGVGFLIENLVLDYSIRLINDLDRSHRFTLGYRFSPRKNSGLNMIHSRPV